MSITANPHGNPLAQTSGSFGSPALRPMDSALERTTQHLNSILTAMPEAVIVTDQRGTITFMNSAAERLTSWKGQDALGKDLQEVFITAPLSSAGDLTDSSVTIEPRNRVLLLSKDGRKIPVDSRVAAIHSNGYSGGFLLVLRDISEIHTLEQRLRESRSKYKGFVNSIEGIVWEADAATHQFLYISKQAERILGYPLQDWIRNQSFWQDHLHPDDRDILVGTWQEAVAEHKHYEVEYRMLAADGRTVWLRDSVSVVKEDGQPVKLHGIMTDITEAGRADREIRALRKAMETMQLGVTITDTKGTILYVNSAEARQHGYQVNDLIGKDVRIFSPRDLRKPMTVSEIRQMKHRQRESINIRKDGSVYPVQLISDAVCDETGEPIGIVTSSEDISDRKRAEEVLLKNAFYDALTGLPNRALFMDRLRLVLERAKQHAQRQQPYLFAVLFLDLDRFKIVNDSLGHIIGDQLLAQVGHRLAEAVRPGDTVARFGGDEFAIVLEEIRSASDATRAAERITEKLRVPFNLDGFEIFSTMSIGIVLGPGVYEHPEHILRDVDAAMYHAKACGRASYFIFDEDLRDRSVRRLNLETDLHRAIELQELKLHYQPIVSLSDRKICGFEALLRWQRGDGELISPEQFIHVLEETGLIVPVGRWVLREACAQMQIWRTQFPGWKPLTVSVNMSASQMVQVDLVDYIEGILKEFRFDAGNLILEITENEIMENSPLRNTVLSQLRRLGTRLHIDDFGKGYSSLSYLQQLPVDALKIDRSFVSRIGVNGDNLQIVRTIASLGQSLGLEVIAEGVETAAHAHLIETLGIPYAQGYFFSKPLRPDEVDALDPDPCMRRFGPNEPPEISVR